MRVRLNGEVYETACSNIEELLQELDIKPEFVAVELNRRIIKRCDLSSTSIADEDNIEIVRFVGGG
ncbi:MAG: sulfur carrier protein ThiS [Thermodesulfovibrionales bacterium]|nr:sulfur carrier protein ThiS [Thermodesulfovibrionales bacterium]